MRTIGILGGTFNPIHYGHLMIAEFLRSELELSKVIFIPTGNPPHKVADVDAIKRNEMVRIAIKGNENFEVSDIETYREGNSYTVDTIIELKKEIKDKLYFLIGLDTLYELKTWEKIDKLSKKIEFVVALRPKYVNEEDIKRELDFLNSKYGTKVRIIHTPQYEISSTELRDRISKNKSCKYLIPDEVLEYINRNELYR